MCDVISKVLDQMYSAQAEPEHLVRHTSAKARQVLSILIRLASSLVLSDGQ